MNYEKQLKEALSNVNTPNVVASWIEKNFPEIKESEDDKIRKSIYNYINVTLGDNESAEKEKWLGWLEKQSEKKSSDEVLKIRQEVYQSGYNDGYKHGCADAIGEQKSINCAENDDKVNSKFKAGDWIIDVQDGEILHINKVRDYAYYVTNLEGASFDTPRCSIETWNRLWTIQDAKAGDVLCGYPNADHPWIGIFCKLNDEGTFNSYCYLQAGEHGHFCSPSEENIFGERNVDNHSSKDVVPATREQRDRLFQKMKVAGYKWDADKKELGVEPKFKVGNGIYEWDDEKKVLKTKPKFKVDDFIKHNKSNIICKVIEVNSNDNSYTVENIGIGGSRIELSNAEQNFHLWSIKDAKDGDVLVTVDNGRPFIYKGCLDPNHPDSPVAYCGIDCEGYFCIGGDIFDNNWWTEEEVQPATKEQRDLLFSKMKEAGYEWSAEKKELKAEPKFKVGDWIVQKYLGKYLGTYKIIEVCESWYEVISYNDGIKYSIGFDKEDDCHLWSIKDAKDGDVLQLGNVTAIFKEFLGNNRCTCYCSVCKGEFEIPIENGDDNVYGCYNDTTPATKEQRDFLFQKVKEAGYEWEAGCLQWSWVNSLKERIK